VIFDTDVLLWVYREHGEALRLVIETRRTAISVVTYMELAQGAHDRGHLQRIRSMLDEYVIDQYPLTEDIGRRAAIYVEEHALSARIGVTDALIAATAVEHGMPLCTANVKHYRPIKDLVIRPFRP